MLFERAFSSCHSHMKPTALLWRVLLLPLVIDCRCLVHLQHAVASLFATRSQERPVLGGGRFASLHVANLEIDAGGLVLGDIHDLVEVEPHQRLVRWLRRQLNCLFCVYNITVGSCNNNHQKHVLHKNGRVDNLNQPQLNRQLPSCSRRRLLSNTWFPCQKRHATRGRLSTNLARGGAPHVLSRSTAGEESVEGEEAVLIGTHVLPRCLVSVSEMGPTAMSPR
mmetsp:Transcript_20176/g.46491  ORF Transcript_20176/g.46491 Transcript_20176/m.46491 type:complete len:223 (-) Transcript_20176:1844-2512(-)